MVVTVNGTIVNPPYILYYDELDFGETLMPVGALECRSDSSARVGWHLTSGFLVDEAGLYDFKQIRTGPGDIPSLSQLFRNRRTIDRGGDHLTNGLWHCRLDGGHLQHTFVEQISIGIYQRGGGE